MTEQFQIIFACVAIISICIYYILKQSDKKGMQASLLRKQKSKLDTVLLPLGYIKSRSDIQLHKYAAIVKQGQRKGEVIEYSNPLLGKKISLFFNQTNSNAGTLAKIYLFQNQDDEETADFIDFSELQRDLNLFFNNTNSLHMITPKQIVKVLRKADEFHTSASLIKSLDSSKLRGYSYQYLKDNFAYLEERCGFAEVYYSGNFANFFKLSQDIVVFQKGNIELITSYYLMRDEWELSIVVTEDAHEKERFSGSFYSDNERQVLTKVRRYVEDNLC